MATNPSMQIFVSYSRSDRLTVDRLVDDLRKRHYVLWMDVDEHGIELGEDWKAELVKQMTASQAVIACGSPDYLTSPFCQAEIAQAKQENKPIFPVLVRRFNANQSFADIDIDNLQFADLTLNYDAGLRKLTGVLPRPRFPLREVLQNASRIAAALLVLALLIGGIALAVRVVNPQPTQPPPATTVPTPVHALEGYDLKVVVAPFVLDPSLSADDQALANDLIARLSQDMQQKIQSLNDQGDVRIGFLGSSQIAPLTGSTDAALRDGAVALAVNGGFDMVVYGSVKRNADGSLEVDPNLYIPPERFADAQEMAGPLVFGAGIILTDTNLDTAYQTSAELRSRVQALVYVVQGVSQYIAHQYSGALQAFDAAASVPNWSGGSQTLSLLEGNVYLQLARDAITACSRDLVLQQLDLAEQQYQQAAAADQQADLNARPYAALAEVSMLRSTWSLVDLDNPCDPQLVDSQQVDQALSYSDQATSAADFASLDAALQAQVVFTKARAQATLWYALDPADPRFESFVTDISGETDTVIGLYQTSTESPLLASTAFEAHFLRGSIRVEVAGACGQDAIDDFIAALGIVQTNKDAVQKSRQMFVIGALGQCYELNQQTDDAIAQYRAAYDIARTLTNGTQDRNFYGCKLQSLTGDPNAASVTTACTDS